MRLENKIGIVTAAASGMGRAGALRFAREGAAVGVADIDQAGRRGGGRRDHGVRRAGAGAGRRSAHRRFRRATSCGAPPTRSAGSISSGTMSAIPARPRSRASTWPISSWRSISICAACW